MKELDPEFVSKILPRTMKYEGGVDTNAVRDSGISNFGVTQKAWNAYAKASGISPKNVKDLSYGDMVRFADTYYSKPKISELNGTNLKAALFDYAYNSGTSQAIKDLQAIVGAKADGVIGKKTIAAVDKFIAKNGEDSLVSSLIENRGNFLAGLVEKDPITYAKFGKGWANRLADLKASLVSQTDTAETVTQSPSQA